MLKKLAEIRNADKATRVKWVIILSTISSALVVLVWVATLNVITTQFERPELRMPDATPVASIGSKISNVFGQLRQRTSNTIEYFKSGMSKATGNEIQLAQPDGTSPAPTESTNPTQ